MKAAGITGGSGTRYVTQYSRFAGVDFSTDPMLVDKGRSPYALNLISDDGGMPKRRWGWRTLHTLGSGRVNGLFRCEFESGVQLLCHVGSQLWRWDTDQPSLLLEGIADKRSVSFFLMGKFYLLTGAEYLVYNGAEVKPVEGYVPTLLVNCPPSGGGGDRVEALNLLSPKWKEEFIGDGSAKTYHLSRKELDESPLECQILSGGQWVEKAEGTDFTVDRAAGTLSFKSAPSSSATVNVRVTAAKTVAGNAEKIRNSHACALYNDSVVFVCGGAKGQDFRSAYGKPDYFPESGYDRVGSDETDIMGYCRLGEYQGIIKQSSGQDSTVVLRWHEEQTDALGVRETVYRKKQGITGVGALAPQVVGTLLDEPLFLSEQGVFGITNSSITYERTVQNRSRYCDSRLTAEPDLDKACTAQWKGYFLVCVNSHCYVMDSRGKTYPEGSGNGYVYECYYWENIPAACFLSHGDTLYFGTGDGRVCRFNTDREGMDCYSDDGEAIPVVWSTCMDDDGHPTHLKTLCKRGCMVTLNPFLRSSVEICLRTERDPVPQPMKRYNLDIFDWEQIDFSRFTFNSNDAAQDVVLNTKVRRYKRLQFYIRSSALNEGFGIFKISKTYRLRGVAKQ